MFIRVIYTQLSKYFVGTYDLNRVTKNCLITLFFIPPLYLFKFIVQKITSCIILLYNTTASNFWLLAIQSDKILENVFSWYKYNFFLLLFTCVKQTACYTEVGLLIDEIQDLYVAFRQLSFNCIPRKCNMVAHALTGC